MGFTCGIVGLPNVGKSTLFNALTASAQAEVANYPFCTIDPNIGRIPVPDPRLERLRELSACPVAVPAQLEVRDIAGLVRGASHGEGLGNRFLAAIREVDAIFHLLRCFPDGEVSHVEGSLDPVRDLELVETELLLADLESLERQAEGWIKKARGGVPEARARLALIDRLRAALEAGIPARSVPLDAEEQILVRHLHLLTAKPVLILCNVEEEAVAAGNRWSEQVAKAARARGAPVLVISAKIEAELAALEPEERREYLESLGLAEPGLNRVLREGYRLLGLITFFTAGPKEARAWTVPRGTTAVEAAGRIHSDFARGFIRAEVIAYEDYVALGGEAGAREAGRMRLEGRDYRIQDGDVCRFRFNV